MPYVGDKLFFTGSHWDLRVGLSKYPFVVLMLHPRGGFERLFPNACEQCLPEPDDGNGGVVNIIGRLQY